MLQYKRDAPYSQSMTTILAQNYGSMLINSEKAIVQKNIETVINLSTRVSGPVRPTVVGPNGGGGGGG